jgi:hypothetical protein
MNWLGAENPAQKNAREPNRAWILPVHDADEKFVTARPLYPENKH